ncbi:hypothetical protein ACLESO_18125 [Pyxidicoccus sp. 3LG]
MSQEIPVVPQWHYEVSPFPTGGLTRSLAGMTERLKGPLRALLVLGWNQQIWRKDANLPFAPFPGLGIRVDVYDLIQVDSVVVGDHGYDVTCICTIEDDAGEYSAERLASLGFEEAEAGYP